MVRCNGCGRFCQYDGCAWACETCGREASGPRPTNGLGVCSCGHDRFAHDESGCRADGCNCGDYSRKRP